MHRNKTGLALIILGASAIGFALLVDIIRSGKLSIQAAQILVIEAGLFFIVIGYLINRQPIKSDTNRSLIYEFTNWLKNLPLHIWIFLGFIAAYIPFFIVPMFFNTPPRIQYFTTYLPDRFPIGADLELLRSLTDQWFSTGQSPFYVQFYPPFTYIFLAPILLVGEYHTLYKLVTIVTLASYLISSLIIPIKLNRQKNPWIIVLFFILGLFSYGMQFELERGQFNVLAFLFAMAAIHIFHRHYEARWVAYLLFSIAIQLKLYPAIFIFMFVRDWKNFKENLIRMFGLGAFNFALLFIGGVKPFFEFLDSVLTQLTRPGWSWTGNHSIKAFWSEFIENNGFGLISSETLRSIQTYSGLISNIFLAAFLACLLSALYLAYRRNQPGLDPILFLICTLGGLIVPISNDYTLSILAAPAAMAFTAISSIKHHKHKIPAGMLSAMASFSISASLYPFKYKPLIFQNLFPMLFILLICITTLNYFVAKTDEPEQFNAQ